MKCVSWVWLENGSQGLIVLLLTCKSMGLNWSVFKSAEHMFIRLLAMEDGIDQ